MDIHTHKHTHTHTHTQITAYSTADASASDNCQHLLHIYSSMSRDIFCMCVYNIRYAGMSARVYMCVCNVKYAGLCEGAFCVLSCTLHTYTQTDRQRKTDMQVHTHPHKQRQRQRPQHHTQNTHIVVRRRTHYSRLYKNIH